jgi:hypothetical protein
VVGQFAGIDKPENVTIYKRSTAGSGTFKELTTTVGDNGTDEVSDDTLYATAESFSEFVLASDTEPLPVEMAGFDARLDEEAVRLTWRTASEQNNAGFRVQRRVGGDDRGGSEAVETDRRSVATEKEAWQIVGRVEGAGTTTEAQSYRFTDGELPYEADALTYRLKQVDADGSAHYSKTVTVERDVDAVRLLGTYPNPASRRATVRYALPERQEVTVRLYDVLGRRVRTVVQGKQEGRQARQLDVSGLPSGVYFLRLRAEGTVKTQRLTVVQ